VNRTRDTDRWSVILFHLPDRFGGFIGGDNYNSYLPCPFLTGGGMKVIGADVGKDFIVLYDGELFHVFYPDGKSRKKVKVPKNAKVKLLNNLSELIDENSVVVLEQTGTYGIRFAKLAEKAGATVLIADGKALNRFRGHVDQKTDYHDAKALRMMYFSQRRKNIHPFHIQRFQLRTIVRHYQRLNKELTRSVNRLKQQLVHLFPEKDYHNLQRYSLFKRLNQIKEELLKSPESLALIAISEIENIQHINKHLEIISKELESIVKNHKDYEILKSFGFGIIQMAVLIAYYWDISLFQNADDFVAYCLMGVRREQSGISVNHTKTDKSRSEIKGIFYLYFLRAHRTGFPLKPLTEYLQLKEKSYKKRFIKFLDRVFRLVFVGLKERKTLEEVIERKITEQKHQLERLEQKIAETWNLLNQTAEREEKRFLTSYSNRLTERYRNTSDTLLVCQDISTLLKQGRNGQGVERQGYYEEAINANSLGGVGDVHLEHAGVHKASGKQTERGREGNRERTDKELLAGVYGALKGRSFREG